MTHCTNCYITGIQNSQRSTVCCQQEPCPEATIFEVRDEHGEVVETANNSAGIYSRLQTVLAPPSIERTTLYEDTNTYKVIIKCPGYVNLQSMRVTYKHFQQNVSMHQFNHKLHTVHK